ncbi:MAG: hypothetical protein JXO22_03170 [Phycisphaerae bacterium]|nr:hypothetical protein [Phycisphaerae bacterium]
MATGASFWRRVGNALRGESGLGGDGGLATVNDNHEQPPSGGWSLLRRRPNRREMSERYERVIELMSAMHTHFERQDEHARQLNTSMHELVDSLAALTDAQQAQGESVRNVADRVVAASQHVASLADTLGRVPASLAAQAESVHALARQLEIAQEADHRVANTLGDLGQAVTSLQTSEAAQVQSLHKLHDRESEQREALANMVREQGRRFLTVTIVAVVMALGAMATMLILILRGH